VSAIIPFTEGFVSAIIPFTEGFVSAIIPFTEGFVSAIIPVTEGWALARHAGIALLCTCDCKNGLVQAQTREQ
jgi:hypothetical protein